MANVFINIKSFFDGRGFTLANQSAQELNQTLSFIRSSFADTGLQGKQLNQVMTEVGRTAPQMVDQKRTLNPFMALNDMFAGASSGLGKVKLGLLGSLFAFQQMNRMIMSAVQSSDAWADVTDEMSFLFDGLLTPAIDLFLPIIEMVVDFFEDLPEPVKQVIGIFILVAGAVTFLIPLFVTFTLAAGGLGVGIGALIAPVLAVIAVISILIAIIFNIGGIRDIIANALIGAGQFILNFFTGLITFFLDLGRRFFEAAINIGRAIVEGIVNGIKALPGLILEALLSIIPEPFRSIFRAGIGAVGQVIGGIAGFLGFQHGGIVTRPTLGIIGEAGPEAVVPLGRGMSGMGSTIIAPTDIRISADIRNDVDLRNLASKLGEMWRQEIGIVGRGGL